MVEYKPCRRYLHMYSSTYTYTYSYCDNNNSDSCSRNSTYLILSYLNYATLYLS